MKTIIFIINYSNSIDLCHINTKNNQLINYCTNINLNVTTTETLLSTELLHANGVQFYHFLNELIVSPCYRYRVIVGLKKYSKFLTIILRPPQKEYIDYKWYF